MTYFNHPFYHLSETELVLCSTFWHLIPQRVNNQLHNSNNKLDSSVALICDNGISFKFNLAWLWYNHLRVTEARAQQRCGVGQV